MALKANELRIGNWVHEADGYGQVTDIIPEWVTTSCTNLSLPIECFTPIPISPEILGKCGFKHGMVEGITRLMDAMDIDDDAEEGDTHYWDLRVPENDKVEGLSTFNLVKFGDADITFSNQWLRVKLYSLHQLQNLYFSLTNEELSINL